MRLFGRRKKVVELDDVIWGLIEDNARLAARLTLLEEKVKRLEGRNHFAHQKEEVTGRG